MNKLVVCYIGQDVERFIQMSLDSIKDTADAIVFIDGGSKDKTLQILTDYKFVVWEEKKRDILLSHKNIFISRPYEHENIGANGRARNAYLDFIKKYYKGWWCLVLDPDEVVQQQENIKLTIEKIEETYSDDSQHVYNIHMRHFIRDLTHEDSTQEKHWCPGRFFRISDDLFYPEIEHPVLQHKNGHYRGSIDSFTIWHLAYMSYIFDTRKRYLNHFQKSDMHSKDYLHSWYLSHITGKYPVRELNIYELPKVLKDYFIPEPLEDILYFNNRGLETKHFIDAIYWKQFFELVGDGISGDVIEFGCGLGPRIFAMNSIGISADGIEISQWAVDHKIHPNINQGDIRTYNDGLTRRLVIAYDILEHLSYEDLDKAINTLINHTHKYILVSVPVIGDPNLENDNTHKIKESMEWWINKFTSKGLLHIDTPQNFLYKNQLIILEKQ